MDFKKIYRFGVSTQGVKDENRLPERIDVMDDDPPLQSFFRFNINPKPHRPLEDFGSEQRKMILGT